MARLKLNSRMMIDCSHANANKDHTRQVNVLDDVAAQVRSGSRHILGVMIESHLKAGSQPIPDNLRELTYGQSITDACVDFDTTAAMLRQLASAVEPSLQTAPLG